MRKSKFLSAFLFVAIAAVVIFSVAALSGNYLGSKKKETGIDCKQTGDEYFVNIQGNKMQPENTAAMLCDKLTITNKDDKLRRIAFGVHNQHVAYNGVIEKILRKDQSFSVILNEPGEFIFHDHLQEETSATFTVK